MKKNNLRLSILTVSIYALFINTSCKKENPTRIIELFTMKANNKTVNVKGISTKIQQGSSNKNYLRIIATLVNNDLVFVEIFCNEVKEKEILNVTVNSNADFGYQTREGEWYEASSNYPTASGNIIVTKNDLSARIIEGSFSGIAVNASDPLDKKIISDGSFAVSY